MDNHDLMQWAGFLVMVGTAAWKLRALVSDKELTEERRRRETEDEKLHIRISDSRDELRREIEKIEATQARQGEVLGRIEGKIEMIAQTR